MVHGHEFDLDHLSNPGEDVVLNEQNEEPGGPTSPDLESDPYESDSDNKDNIPHYSDISN